MAFYLKYRPQKIEELDSKQVRNSLSAFFSSASFPHAFLFTGPKGIGKTSAARIIAKLINCPQRLLSKNSKDFYEPCNQCHLCLSISQGTSLDILEIDAASNRGIDEIRELRAKINLAPASATYKVYIIDEVHMLTVEAFNALLKTLEEPPKHVVFILCTTEKHKIPQTILSRSAIIAFAKATQEELLRSLSRIVQGENLNIEKEALAVIADLADGSFRDGAKLLEQVASFNKKLITLADVRSILSLSAVKEKEILVSILNKQANEAIALINNAVSQGVDPKILVRQLLLELRKLLLEKVKDQKNDIIGFKDLKSLIDLFIKADSQMRYSPVVQLPLELAVVEFCFKERGEVKDV